MPDQNFIDNEWRGARSGATDDILNPATGATIGTAPASEAADVDDAVAAERAGRHSLLMKFWSRIDAGLRVQAIQS